MHCCYSQSCSNFYQWGTCHLSPSKCSKQTRDRVQIYAIRKTAIVWGIFFIWNNYFGWKGLICCKRNTCTLKVKSWNKPKPNQDLRRARKLGEDTGEHGNYIIKISLAPRWFLDLWTCNVSNLMNIIFVAGLHYSALIKRRNILLAFVSVSVHWAYCVCACVCMHKHCEEPRYFL